MGPLGAQEMICIFVLALLLFGPKKLPELGRMLGKAVAEFRRAKSELKATFETHLSELERETRTSLDTTNNTYTSPQYPYPYDDYGRYDSDYGSTSTPNESTPAISSTGDSAAEPHHEYTE